MAKYTIRTTGFESVERYISTGRCKLINTDNTLYNYSHVVLDTEPSSGNDGEFIVFNPPSSLMARKFYLEVIRLAELRNLDKNNNNDGFITIADIASIITKVNSSPYRISHGRLFLQITGSKITDIVPNKIECWYKFPTDNAYMIICKSRPNLIEIMPGNMKTNKEVVDKNVDN